MTKVTVLCAVFNGERDIANMIESVLESTYSDFELLIIDDCSTDSTPSILASWDDRRIRVIRNHHNMGLTRSLNIGVKSSNSTYISRIDADDLFVKRRLADHVKTLDDDPALFMVGSRSLEKLENGDSVILSAWYSTEEIERKLKYTNLFTHSAVTFRRDIFIRLGGYDEDYYCTQDYELWHRAVYRYGERVIMLDSIGVKRQIDRSSISGRKFFEQSKNGFKIRRGSISFTANLRLFTYQVLTSWLSFRVPIVVRLIRAMKASRVRAGNG